MILHVIAFVYLMVGAYLANDTLEEVVSQPDEVCLHCYPELFWPVYRGHFGAMLFVTAAWLPVFVVDLFGTDADG